MTKEPRRNVYVGHRYVPKIMGEWEKTETYEGLSIVTHQGASYTSKKRVPKGIDILNTEYWVITGNYNAQVDYYRDEVRQFKDGLDGVAGDMTQLETDLTDTMNDLRSDVTQDLSDLENTVDGKLDYIEGSLTNDMIDLETDVNTKIDDINDTTVYNNGITYTKHYHNDSNTIYYLTRIPRKDPKTNKTLKLKQYTDINNAKTVEEFADELDSDFVINAGWGDTELEYVWIEDGKIKNNKPSDKPSRYTLGITDDGTLKSYHNTDAQTILSDGVVHAHTAFVPIIRNGNKNNSVFNASSGLGARHPRQVIGQYSDKSLIILTTDGRGYNGDGLSASECADILYREGVEFAYMTDGGGSTQTVIRHQMINVNTNNTNMASSGTDRREGMGNYKRKRQSVLYIERPSNEIKDEAIKQVSKDLGSLKNNFDLYSKTNNYFEWKFQLYPIGGGTDQFTYERNNTYVIRTGNIVNIFYDIKATRTGSQVGNLRLTRLPFYPAKINDGDGKMSYTNPIARFNGLESNADRLTSNPFIEFNSGSLTGSIFAHDLLNNNRTRLVKTEDFTDIEMKGVIRYPINIENYNN